MDEQKEIHYEEAFKELQTIVANIETGAISIDLLSEQVERAVHLIKICQEKLTSVGSKVDEMLLDIKQDNGTI